MNKQELKKQRGQGLIEYLIIVAIMAVTAVGILRVMGQTVTAKFATITYALQGKKRIARSEQVTDHHYRKKDFSDFFQGAASDDK